MRGQLAGDSWRVLGLADGFGTLVSGVVASSGSPSARVRGAKGPPPDRKNGLRTAGGGCASKDVGQPPSAGAGLHFRSVSDSTLAKMTGKTWRSPHMIDGSLQESSHQGGDPHAIATGDGSPLGSLRSTVFRPRLGPRTDLGHRGHPRHRQTHGHLRLAHHGIEPRRPLHQLPSRPQSRRLVPPRRQSPPARPDCPDPRPGGLAHRPGGRRHHRAAPRPQDQGQGLLPRCRPVLAEGGGQVLRTEVGRDDGPRPTPLEQAGPGDAIPDRLGSARIGAAAAGTQDVDRLREADGPPGTPLVPPAACRAGARWRVRGREAGRTPVAAMG